MKDKNLVKIKQKKIFEEILSSYKVYQKEISNLKDLYNLAFKEKDEETLKDCDPIIDKIYKRAKKSEVNCFLSGQNDHLNIYIEIHAGAGGTESRLGWNVKKNVYNGLIKNYSHQIISEHSDEAGIKSST